MKLEVKPEDVLNSIFSPTIQFLEKLKMQIEIGERLDAYLKPESLVKNIVIIQNSLNRNIQELKNRIKE